MKDCTYYDLLGVPMDATDEQLSAAKNFLAKKFHPDANMDSNFDTTVYIQNVLHAYRLLSDPKKRRAYDRHLSNPVPRERKPRRQAYTPENVVMSPNFAPFWEAANKLNEIITTSSALCKHRRWGRHEIPEDTLYQLKELASQADVHIRILESAEIPKDYWFSHAMNWILFQWSQHRDFSYPMLFTMYDSYLEQHKSAIDKKKIQLKRNTFLNQLEHLMEYQAL